MNKKNKDIKLVFSKKKTLVARERKVDSSKKKNWFITFVVVTQQCSADWWVVLQSNRIINSKRNFFICLELNSFMTEAVISNTSNANDC